MALSYNSRYLHSFSWLQIRVRQLSAAAQPISASIKQSPFWKHKRYLLGPCLIVLSLTMGLRAYRLTQEETLEEWEIHHSPSEKIWQRALLEKGYQRMMNASTLGHVNRTLPLHTSGDHASQIWTSPDGRWVILLPPLFDPQLPAVFIRQLNNKEKPTTWQPLGSGWQGFEKWLNSIPDNLPLLSTPTTPKKTDPLAIQY